MDFDEAGVAGAAAGVEDEDHAGMDLGGIGGRVGGGDAADAGLLGAGASARGRRRCGSRVGVDREPRADWLKHQ